MPTHKKTIAEMSTYELASLCESDTRTVRRRLAAGGVQPLREDGRTIFWPASQALRAVLTGSGVDPSKAKARLDTARAELAELDLKKRRGELLELSEVAALNVAVSSTIATALLALPSRVAPLLDGELPISEREAILRTHVHEVLEELSQLGHEIDPEAETRGAPAAV